MNNDYLEGFLKAAAAKGVSKDAAIAMYKQAGGDPNAQSLGAGISAPPPTQLGAGQPPMPQDPSGGMGGPPPGDPSGGQGGVPPEIEQLIQSLPPEVLQQLIAEIEQDLSAGGPPPGAGGPPPGQQKVGSVNILCKTAEYAQGFFEAASDYGLTKQQANNFYKQAVSLMEKSPVDPQLLLDTNEKQAQHYEGFVRAAIDNGYSVKQAQDSYFSLFANK